MDSNKIQKRKGGNAMKKLISIGVMVTAVLFMASCGGGGGGGPAPATVSVLSLTGSFSTTEESQTSSNLALPLKSLGLKAGEDEYTIVCTLLSDPTKTCSATVSNGSELDMSCDGFVGKDFKCDIESSDGTDINSFSVAPSADSDDYSSLLSTSGSSIGMVLDLDDDTTVASGYIEEGEMDVTDPTDLSDLTGQWLMTCKETDMIGGVISKEKCPDGENMYLHVSGGGEPVNGSKIGVWPSLAAYQACGSPTDEVTDIAFKVSLGEVDYALDYTNPAVLKASYRAIYDALSEEVRTIIDKTAIARMSGHVQRCKEMLGEGGNPISADNCKYAKVSPDANGFIDFGAITYAAVEDYAGEVEIVTFTCGGADEFPCPPDAGDNSFVEDAVAVEDGNPIFLVCKDPFGHGAIQLPARDETKELSIDLWTEKFGGNTGCGDDNGMAEVDREKYRIVGDFVSMDPMMFSEVDTMCSMMGQMMDQEIGRMREEYAQFAALAEGGGGEGGFQVPPEFQAADADHDSALSDDEARNLMRRFQPPEMAIMCDPELTDVRDTLKAMVAASCTARVHWDHFCDESGSCSERIVCNDSSATDGGCKDANGNFAPRVSQRHDLMTLRLKNNPYFVMDARDLERHRIRGEGGEQEFCKVSHSVKFFGEKVDNNTVNAELFFNESDGCWSEKQDSGSSEESDVGSRASEFNNRFSATITRVVE